MQPASQTYHVQLPIWIKLHNAKRTPKKLAKEIQSEKKKKKLPGFLFKKRKAVFRSQKPLHWDCGAVAL